MQMFYTMEEGMKVPDYSKHVLEGVFPDQLFCSNLLLQESSSVDFVREASYRYSELKETNSTVDHNLEILEVPNMYNNVENEMSSNILEEYVPDDFQKNLFLYLGVKGYENRVPDFYNKAGISRQLFANILSYNKDYTPSKETLYKIILTLELSYSEAKDLLSTKGYTISRSVKFDVVAGYCLENEIYDQTAIDELFFENCQLTLFSHK